MQASKHWVIFNFWNVSKFAKTDQTFFLTETLVYFAVQISVLRKLGTYYGIQKSIQNLSVQRVLRQRETLKKQHNKKRGNKVNYVKTFIVNYVNLTKNIIALGSLTSLI